MKLDLNHFKETVEKEEIMYLATSDEQHVTLRPVSPLLIEEKGIHNIYFYTSNQSNKYKQLMRNPNVSINIGQMGIYQAEGVVRFLGGVFEDKNTELKEAYTKKYPGAFEHPAPGEDMKSNEFLVVEIKLLKGWIYEGEQPVGFAQEIF